MSEPYKATGKYEDIEKWDDEFFEALGCLHSPPSPMPEEEMLGDGYYLSQQDWWVAHAVEHIKAMRGCYRTALKMIETQNKALQNARDAIEVMKGHLPDWAQDILVEIDNALGKENDNENV